MTDTHLHTLLRHCKDLITLSHFTPNDTGHDHSLFRVQGINIFAARLDDSAGAQVTAMGVFSDILKIQREYKKS